MTDISHTEAIEIASRLIAGAFRRDDKKPLFSIPANPERDDDLRMMAYIKQQQSGWRPIESAPKNESVLIYIPNAEHYGPPIYRGMLVDMTTGPHWLANTLHMDRDCGSHNKPTHWMPLPEPPAE